MSYFYSHEDLNFSVRSSSNSKTKNSQLDIFSQISTDSEIQSVFWEKTRCPADDLDISKPSVTFQINPSSDVTDLSDSYWSGTLKLQKKKADGGWENLGPDDKVAPVNNYFYALWEDQFLKVSKRYPFICRAVISQVSKRRNNNSPHSASYRWTAWRHRQPNSFFGFRHI